MIERLIATETRYMELLDELAKPEVLSNINLTRTLSKELSDLEDVVMTFRVYKKVMEDITDTKEMTKDKDLGEMAREELVELEQKEQDLLASLELLLIPKDPDDGKNVIVEIRGAAGGDEANIFAGDLFRMYTRYALNQGFSYEVYNSIDGTSGGFSQIEFIVKGKGAYSKLKYESGSHRVQRVPETESQGRIQTSTATVLVMPEIENIDFELEEKDIKVDVYRSSGAGGQHVNTTDSAVRMTHLPTGIVVTCQNERSQIKNRERALVMLKAKICDQLASEKEAKEGTTRRSKIGTGDRSEKIRTYNYPQNRVTDHRISFTTKQLDRVMEGDLDELIEALILEDQKRHLEGR